MAILLLLWVISTLMEIYKMKELTEFKSLENLTIIKFYHELFTDEEYRGKALERVPVKILCDWSYLFTPLIMIFAISERKFKI